MEGLEQENQALLAGLEQENQALRAEVIAAKAKIEEFSAMKTQIEELTKLVKVLSTAQNPPLPPPPVRTQAEASASAAPEWTFCTETPKYSAPRGTRLLLEVKYRSMPWYPPFTTCEVLRPIASKNPMPTFQQASHVPPPRVAFSPATMTYSAPIVHAILEDDEPIYHSGDMGAYDKVDELRGKYDEMQREMRALRGKEIFGKTAYDLCLVPNIQIPHKFKVPDFEKYKGNSCLEEHLTMYVRRMSAYARDDQVLIYYFQESLASPATKWYMNLDKTKI